MRIRALLYLSSTKAFTTTKGHLSDFVKQSDLMSLSQSLSIQCHIRLTLDWVQRNVRSKDLWNGTLVHYTCSKDLHNGTHDGTLLAN